jgi:type II secretory pathway pseudopilin PulG
MMPKERSDDGFTVIELLIAMVLMILLLAPLATSFALGLGTTHATERDTVNSADAQILSAFFDIDVSSSKTVDVTSSCGGSGTVLALRWDDGGQQEAAYVATLDPDRRTELQLSVPIYKLERVTCGSSPGTSVVAHTLLAPPTVTCDGVLCSSTTTTPRRVTLRAQDSSNQQSDLLSTDRYTFGVTATRKITP